MQPILVIYNEGSGSSGAPKLRGELEEAFADSDVTFFAMGGVPSALEKAVKDIGARGGIAVAAGGDGTVNAVAACCYAAKVPLGVIPLGTFNYFARDLGIPTAFDKAVEVVKNGHLREASAAFAGEKMFLNNASFGLYATIIRNRENSNTRFGRYRLVALVSAVATLLGQHKYFSVQLKKDAEVVAHRTSMLFVGHNTMQLHNLGMEVAECADRHALAVVVLKPLRRLQMGRLLLFGMLKSLKREEKLVQYCATDFELTTPRAVVHGVIDGEILTLPGPLHFRIDPAALQVMVPMQKGGN